MGRAGLLWVVLLALAGCGAPARLPPEISVPAIEFVYACPAGPGPHPCPATITTDATVEPAVALDPTNARRLAVAAGVATPAGSTAVRGCLLRVWTSGDAGAHWEATAPPLPPLDGVAAFGSRCTRSPSLAFDGVGRLHLVAFDSATDPAGQQSLAARNVYVRSDDLGRSWGHATVLFDGNHPWVTVAPGGTLVVTSRSGTVSGENWAKIARSEDGGATWARHEPGETVGCVLPSRPALAGDELLFACARYEGPGPRGRIEVVRVDPGDGSVEIRGSVPFEEPVETPAEDQFEYARGYVAGFPDGRAVLHFTLYGDDRVDAYLATSRDGGRTWDAVVDAADLLEAGARQVDLVHAAGPAGSTHLWAFLSDGTTADAHHVVLDAAGQVAQRRPLAIGLRASTLPRDDELKGFVYPGGALGWAGETGLLAWEHPSEGGGLRVLRLAVQRLNP